MDNPTMYKSFFQKSPNESAPCFVPLLVRWEGWDSNRKPKRALVSWFDQDDFAQLDLIYARWLVPKLKSLF
jgi:hypothetical protein